jgi:hypothetical protein
MLNYWLASPTSHSQDYQGQECLLDGNAGWVTGQDCLLDSNVFHEPTMTMNNNGCFSRIAPNIPQHIISFITSKRCKSTKRRDKKGEGKAEERESKSKLLSGLGNSQCRASAQANAPSCSNQ